MFFNFFYSFYFFRRNRREARRARRDLDETKTDAVNQLKRNNNDDDDEQDEEEEEEEVVNTSEVSDSLKKLIAKEAAAARRAQAAEDWLDAEGAVEAVTLDDDDESRFHSQAKLAHAAQQRESGDAPPSNRVEDVDELEKEQKTQLTGEFSRKNEFTFIFKFLFLKKKKS